MTRPAVIVGSPVVWFAGTSAGSTPFSLSCNDFVAYRASPVNHSVGLTPVWRSQALANLSATACAGVAPGLVDGGRGELVVPMSPSSGIGEVLTSVVAVAGPGS